MSRGQDATAPSIVDGREMPPMVEVIDYPEKPTIGEFISICQRIRNILSSGRAVALVLKTNDPTYEWSEESIGHLISDIPGLDGCKDTIFWQSKLPLSKRKRKA